MSPLLGNATGISDPASNPCSTSWTACVVSCFGKDAYYKIVGLRQASCQGHKWLCKGHGRAMVAHNTTTSPDPAGSRFLSFSWVIRCHFCRVAQDKMPAFVNMDATLRCTAWRLICRALSPIGSLIDSQHDCALSNLYGVQRAVLGCAFILSSYAKRPHPWPDNTASPTHSGSYPSLPAPMFYCISSRVRTTAWLIRDVHAEAEQSFIQRHKSGVFSC